MMQTVDSADELVEFAQSVQGEFCFTGRFRPWRFVRAVVLHHPYRVEKIPGKAIELRAHLDGIGCSLAQRIQ